MDTIDKIIVGLQIFSKHISPDINACHDEIFAICEDSLSATEIVKLKELGWRDQSNDVGGWSHFV